MSRGTKLTSYQRFVVAAAWLGFGFDMMEGVLFSFVARTAVPDLLDLPAGAPPGEVIYWTGLVTSIFLLGWAIGGLAFGWLCDRIGRARTVVLTILIYSFGTAATALAPNIAVLAMFRFIGAVGIGGEFAAGVTLVAESVPEERRVSMGTLLASAGIAGGLFAMLANHLVMNEIDALAGRPDLQWRAVMATGLLPAILAVVFRRKLREPERWQQAAKHGGTRGRLRDLFAPGLRARVIGGAVIATLSLTTIWSTGTFLPQLAGILADEAGGSFQSYMMRVVLYAYAGTILGMLLAAPIAERFGRRALFVVGFFATAVMIVVAFSMSWPPSVRMLMVGAVNIPLGAVSSALNFYLTELFPLALRGSGVSVAMNIGRFVMLLGPALVGVVAKRGVPVLEVLTWTAIAPALGGVLVLVGLGVETKGKHLDT